jgi:hypothetical protein
MGVNFTRLNIRANFGTNRNPAETSDMQIALFSIVWVYPLFHATSSIKSQPETWPYHYIPDKSQ